MRGRGGAVRHQAQGLVVFGIGLALTSGSLAALNAATSEPAHSTELAVLIAANLAATVLRFLLFRAWVFSDRREDDSPSGVLVSHNPASPTYATVPPVQQPYAQQSYGRQPYEQQQPDQQQYGQQPHGRHQYGQQPPLPQRPTAPTYATGPQSSYRTTEFRAGEDADRNRGDVTAHLQPMRPTDTDSRNS
ncbi:hypothetical protein SALBM311S_05920 [Streptomyces alboniger]